MSETRDAVAAFQSEQQFQASQADQKGYFAVRPLGDDRWQVYGPRHATPVQKFHNALPAHDYVEHLPVFQLATVKTVSKTAEFETTSCECGPLVIPGLAAAAAFAASLSMGHAAVEYEKRNAAMKELAKKVDEEWKTATGEPASEMIRKFAARMPGPALGNKTALDRVELGGPKGASGVHGNDDRGLGGDFAAKFGAGPDGVRNYVHAAAEVDPRKVYRDLEEQFLKLLPEQRADLMNRIRHAVPALFEIVRPLVPSHAHETTSLDDFLEMKEYPALQLVTILVASQTPQTVKLSVELVGVIRAQFTDELGKIRKDVADFVRSQLVDPHDVLHVDLEWHGRSAIISFPRLKLPERVPAGFDRHVNMTVPLILVHL